MNKDNITFIAVLLIATVIIIWFFKKNKKQSSEKSQENQTSTGNQTKQNAGALYNGGVKVFTPNTKIQDLIQKMDTTNQQKQTGADYNQVKPLVENVDPQTLQTYSNGWYDDIASTLYELFDGFTSDAEEAQIIKLIARCKTRKDIELLKTAYSKVDKKYDLIYRVNDDIKDGGCLPELNAALRSSGCDYQF